MPAYVVKHLVSKHGPLSGIMKEVKETPHSFTSKELEATAAANSGDVYVVEVRSSNSKRGYALGYRYQAQEKFGLAGGLWRGEFKFKVSATPGLPASGVYFDEPIRIEDENIIDWLSSKQPGMEEIPSHLVFELENIFANPANGAKRFA